MSRSILVLGRANKTRSIMAEAYINHVARGRWRAHSAGLVPADEVDPSALRVLEEAGIATPSRPKPKSSDVFTAPTAPPLDVLVSVCEHAAADEQLLAWPGSPRVLHWPLPDPTEAAVPAADRDDVFRAVLELIRERADLFLEDERSRRTLKVSG
jgi:arsenate reductase